MLAVWSHASSSTSLSLLVKDKLWPEIFGSVMAKRDIADPVDQTLGARKMAFSCLSLIVITIFCFAREETPVAAVEAPTPVLGEPMDLMTALQLVMKKSSAHDGLVKGLREAAKAIEKHAAQLCVLAEDCDQPDYVKLVKALCAEHNVHLVTVPSAKTLGEWAGLCKIDSEGKARKVVGCSCVVIKDYGEESEGLNIVQEYVKSH
ncbi:hypothetical protein PR202_gb08876 [Eleusine coracana subsp. coracana]|uniref:40S ribosomal protein S12 n=1 Tax=Eleusine coracana subsp. coracana TaxID=191504 RepID=A0AAV5EDC4_ELECO|nr:hypothetical protein PR202_gb08876 [Eleusine coracana subsp. coracana]